MMTPGDREQHHLKAMTRILRIDATGTSEVDDVLAIEEPLEIRVGDKPVSVTLRTPGDDFDLAAGFLFSESILRSGEEVDSYRHWGSPNVVRVSLREGVRVDLQRLQRHFYSTSSCGVCGKVTIDALRVQTTPIESPIRVSRDVVNALPEQLRAHQTAFDATGGIHAAGIFSADGTLLRIREDVGRHNAVDKVIGSFFREGTPLGPHILMVSGRTSFEIVQKAIVARIHVLAAVGAPSTLAVDLAREFGLTLLGFVRDGRLNVYAGEVG
jgi:FdhD protein